MQSGTLLRRMLGARLDASACFAAGIAGACSRCSTMACGDVVRYLCNDATINHAAPTKCISFGNMRVDAAVSAEVLRAISAAGARRRVPGDR